MTDFTRYGKFDTPEHAKNGLTGPYSQKLAKARLDLYKAHEKAKGILAGKIKKKG